MKRLLIVVLVAALVAGSVVPAAAGSKARGRWEGLAIGLGAVSLYNLFSHGMFAPVVPPRAYAAAPTVVYQQPAVVYQAPAAVCPPPAYQGGCGPDYGPDYGPGYYGPERVWVPGYYERHERWIPGHWEWR